MHPSEDCIATGTSSGKIILWYNYLTMFENGNLNAKKLGDEEEMETENGPIKINKKYLKKLKPTMTVLHWHSLPVLSLAFSTEGSYLLSGGHECVLVKWLFKTGQKDFKPRLGAPICELASSLDNTLYVSRHVDNSKLEKQIKIFFFS
jgi:NET1-associated nuclear protein 1 (U3 small nucleolar RNA-associated protein 17)